MKDEPQDGEPDYDALAREAEMGYTKGQSVERILLGTTDAVVWAYHFKHQFGTVCPDEHTMVTWFANAIETGRDAGRRSVDADFAAIWRPETRQIVREELHRAMDTGLGGGGKR